MNELQTITANDKAKQLLLIRHKRDQLRALINRLDEEYNQLRDDLLTETQNLKVLTLKTEEYTIQRKKSRTPRLLNQADAIADLKNRGMQYYLKLDLTAIKGALLSADRNKTPVNGIEIRETEYIAIKKNEEAK